MIRIYFIKVGHKFIIEKFFILESGLTDFLKKPLILTNSNMELSLLPFLNQQSNDIGSYY